MKISQREVLYLFEAYCTLLRASSEAKDDVEWLGQVAKHGGIIVSVDGIQPEKGNETVYKAFQMIIRFPIRISIYTWLASAQRAENGPDVADKTVSSLIKSCLSVFGKVS